MAGHDDHGWMQSALDNGRLTLEAGREYHLSKALVVTVPGTVIDVQGTVYFNRPDKPRSRVAKPFDFLRKVDR